MEKGTSHGILMSNMHMPECVDRRDGRKEEEVRRREAGRQEGRKEGKQEASPKKEESGFQRSTFPHYYQSCGSDKKH